MKGRIRPPRDCRAAPAEAAAATAVSRDGHSDHEARQDAALLLRRQHLRRLVHRARPVQDPGLQTRHESTHDQNLLLQILAGESSLLPRAEWFGEFPLRHSSSNVCLP